jgi:hypothetical protein
MNYVKLSVAAAVLAVASTAIAEENSITADVGVTAYVAQGLGASVTQNLLFPHIVIPDEGNEDHSISVWCNGATVKYSHPSAKPSGPAGESINNFNVNGPTSDLNGAVTISGEPGYAVSISTYPSINLDSAGTVSLEPRLRTPNAPGTGPGLTMLQDSISNSGDLTIRVCGTLTVTSAATATSEYTGDIPVTVSYY